MTDIEKLENQILDWALNMVAEFTWLRIKFEYSETYRTFMVGYFFATNEPDDEFYSKALAFEDLMTEEYGDDAPLFSDNEEFFALSENAKVVEAAEKTFTSTIMDIDDFDGSMSWKGGNALELTENVPTYPNFDAQSVQHDYFLAEAA